VYTRRARERLRESKKEEWRWGIEEEEVR